MRLVAAVLAAYLISGSAVAAAEPPTVVAVDKCPAKSGCIVMDIHVLAESKVARAVGPSKSACGGKIYRVRGRLRGSAVRTYHLALQGVCMMDCADGRAAYFGRTARNAPIIMTDLGRFEIVDYDVSVGVADDLLVLDESRRAVAKYIGNFAGSDNYFVERARVYMRHGDGSCVTAPQARAGLLAIVDKRHCLPRPAEEDVAVGFTDLATASRIFLEKWAEPFRGKFTVADALKDSIHRNRDGLIVVQRNGNCYRQTWISY